MGNRTPLKSLFLSLVTVFVLILSIDAQAAWEWRWPWSRGQSCGVLAGAPSTEVVVAPPQRVVPAPILPPSVERLKDINSLTEFRERVEVDHNSAQFRDSLMSDFHKPTSERDGPAHGMFMDFRGASVQPLLLLFANGISGFQRGTFSSWHRGGGSLSSEKTFYNALHYIVSHPKKRNSHILASPVIEIKEDRSNPFAWRIEKIVTFKGFDYRILEDSGENSYTLTHVSYDGKVTTEKVDGAVALEWLSKFREGHQPTREFSKPLAYPKRYGSHEAYANADKVESEVRAQKDALIAANEASGSQWEVMEPSKFTSLPNGTEVAFVFTEAVIISRQYHRDEISSQKKVRTLQGIVSGTKTHSWSPVGGTWDRKAILMDVGTLWDFNDTVVTFDTGRSAEGESFARWAHYKWDIEIASRHVQFLLVKPPRL